MTTPTGIPSALLTASQLAALLQISTRSIWRLKSAGKLPAAIELGGLIRWSDAEVRKWIASGCPAQNLNQSHRRRG